MKYSFVGLFVLYLLVFVHGNFLTGQWLYYHDSIVVFTNLHLFFDAIFNGRLPLWSPEINGGEPLWHLVETFPAFDPIAIPVFALARLLGVPSVIAYQWTCIVWLLIFAWGGMVLSRRFYRSFWVQLCVFGILFGGPIAASLAKQSQGFIVPWRYTPWVLLALLELDRTPSWRRAIILGVVGALSVAGYQTSYSVFFVSVFWLSFLLGKSLRKLPLMPAKYYLVAIGVALVGILPTLLAGKQMLALFPLARKSMDLGWWYLAQNFIFTFFDLKFVHDPYHGGVQLGWVGPGMATLGLIGLVYTWGKALVGRWVPSARCHRLPFRPLEFALGVTFLVCLFMGVGNQQHPGLLFMGVRNWGFLLTPLVLCLVLLAVVGLRFSRRLVHENGLLAFLALLGLGWLCFGKIDFNIATTDNHELKRLGILFALLVPLWVVMFFRFHPRKTRAARQVAVAFAIITMVSLAWFTKGSEGLIRANSKLRGRFPQWETTNLLLPERREGVFPILSYVPYHYQGPSIRHRYYAKIWPVVSRDLKDHDGEDHEITPITHQFRLRRYQALMEANLPVPVLLSVLGVSEPIVRIIPRAISVSDGQAAIAWLRNQTPQKLRRSSAIEGPLPAHIVKSNVAGKGSWRLGEFGMGRATFLVNMKSPGVFTYGDAYTKRWRVEVDGERRPLLVANGWAKAVALGVGSHEVSFRYRPLGYLIAWWIRVAFYMAVLVGMGVMVLPIKKGLRWLGRSVYPALVPTVHIRGAERYLEDMWRESAPWVALIHTGLAVAFCFLPFCFGKLRWFPALSQKDKERVVRRVLVCRIYLLRMIGYAVKGHAFVAIFRNPQARRDLLTFRMNHGENLA